MTGTRHERLPPRTLPVVYLAFGHVCLAGAFLLVALRPGIGAFFYQPKMFAAVHLVTLGWLTCSILGATYIVAPLALRATMPAGRVDGIACGFFLAGVAGVVAHFLLETFPGVAWSGIMLLLAFAVVAVRTWRALVGAGAPRAVKVHVGLAYANLLLTGAWGTQLAFSKGPGYQLPQALGHAHLGLVGWATLMFVGVAYRMLPMLLPAKPPRGPLLWLSALLFEAGAVGLAVTLALKSEGGGRVFAVVTAAAVLVFLVLVAGMRLRRVPAPPKLKRPDLGMGHALLAFASLVGAAVYGLEVAWTPGWQLPELMVYATLGLVGFLAQGVVGIGMRLYPMFAWTEAWAGSGHTVLPPSPFAMPVRALQAASLALWAFGVPALAWGFGGERESWIVAGAWALFLGAVVSAVNTGLVVRHAYARQPAAGLEEAG